MRAWMEIDLMEATGWTPDQLDDLDDELLTRILAKRAVDRFEASRILDPDREGAVMRDVDQIPGAWR